VESGGNNSPATDNGSEVTWRASAARRVAFANRRVIAVSVYAGVAGFSYFLSYLLRFDFTLPREYAPVFLQTLPLLIAIRALLGVVFRLSTGRWRFVGTSDVLRLVFAVSAGSIVFYFAAGALPLALRVPRSVILCEWVLSTYLTAGVWIVYRTAFERLRQLRASANGSARRVLIVGAGEAGNLLAREMLRQPTGSSPVGFVDDEPTKWGTRLQGLAVLATTAELPEITRRFGVDDIAIAMPSATPQELRRIVLICESTGLPFRVLPGIAEVLQGDVRLNQLRAVQIEDLLGREPISLELPELADDLRGRSVLITGAAGSIGSELSRQVALHAPRVLVLFDQAETGLYYLERELRDRHADLHLVCIVGDITDEVGVSRLYEEHLPSRVFHAAAYKHVPMMELNVREALRNNVLGTRLVAEAAAHYGAQKFVLVSSDKAVRPSSVMGATKRLSELVLLELQARHPKTAYAAVRFGNVMGSAGSVIPIFRSQIEAGRPLTITHPEATRYFMTIPEAVQLILQASLLPEVRGRIAMLEMGEPVRILDLAENMLRISGATRRNGDRFVFTGLRSGEKLHEELCAPDESTTATAIPKVRLVAPSMLLVSQVPEWLEQWEAAFAERRDDRVIGDLLRIFPSLHIQPVGQRAGPLLAR
jgi:FlaA1/EpsC-like NDP-sugar epimerase